MHKIVNLPVQRLLQSCVKACVNSLVFTQICVVVNSTIHILSLFSGNLLDLYKQAIMAKQQIGINLLHIINRPYNNNILSI